MCLKRSTSVFSRFTVLFPFVPAIVGLEWNLSRRAFFVLRSPTVLQTVFRVAEVQREDADVGRSEQRDLFARPAKAESFSKQDAVLRVLGAIEVDAREYVRPEAARQRDERPEAVRPGSESGHADGLA